MSDDQMRGLKDLLRSESGGVTPDDTAPMSRPTRQGRGLSALTTSPQPPPSPADADPQELADPTTLAERDPPTVPPARPDAPPRPSTRADRTAPAPTAPASVGEQPATPRRKTSVTLPPTVRDRVADAYHQSRWTLLALLELAGERLASGEITRSDVEAAVTALADGGGSASIRSLSVPTALLAQFDDRSGAWRLSRSALLAACLVLVLDHLPD
jgi:hypothetical protein